MSVWRESPHTQKELADIYECTLSASCPTLEVCQLGWASEQALVEESTVTYFRVEGTKAQRGGAGP